MDDEQIWAQLDLRLKPVCDMLEFALDAEPQEEDDQDNNDTDEFIDEQLLSQMRALESGDGLDEMELDTLDEEEQDSEEDEELGAESEEESADDVDLGEGVTSLRDPSSDEDSEPEADSHRPSSLRKGRGQNKSSAGSKTGLNDGFFDLASFNAETEEAEARKVSRGRLNDDDDDSDEESVDLFAPVDVAENFDEEDEDNAGEAFYKDFFEPPRHTAPVRTPKPISSQKKSGTVRFHEEVRVKNIKAKGKNLPLNTLDEDDDDDDDDDEERDLGKQDSANSTKTTNVDGAESDEDSLQGSFNGAETIERLKGDLFAEEEDEPPEDLSTHEQRMSALREQISSLEAENVGPKDWVVMGEAGARARPQNSLLEEDLEFERVMKAVPVVTEESVLVLEERIKARILEGRFDDVVRIRPMEDKPFLPSRFFELKDTKSTQSLAQIYEGDYVAAQANGGVVDDRDGKLHKEHEELDALWEGICGKLDALCNAHFMPKQPKATISSISNVSTATMESALPTTKSTTSMLAPEEVFATSSSDPRARSELTPAEKRALRGKERKAKMKSRDNLNNSVDKYAKLKGIGGIKKQKQAALASVVKTGKGVTVVGKEKMGKSRPRKAP
ncbi:U3 small nucleolar ribonucleoprotein complex, subunit Mpp10 [Mycena rosella]|uniref:U3 small nucleolar ribonucleoprotein protein MPP10 n=1 Tax=Mycena rosella TaxID=1033263 RepID=A0AAD7GVI8_MYCRO|nr:U3 small nucleolar ribonucleoprotein complex, subunit Mpp10 [Mycena rosella]